MPDYTVRDTTTGQMVTFRWHAAAPPTEADMAEVFAAARAPAPPPAPSAPKSGDDVTALMTPARAPRTWTDTAADLLPAAGGVVGGILGGVGGTVAGMGVGGVPGAIGGATVGGGLGEAAKQLVNRARGHAAPASPMAAAGAIAQQAALQGGAEAIGAGVGQAAATGARAVYRGYLKPALSQRLLPKAQEAVETAIREALPITRGGVQRGQRMIGELRQEVDDLLAQSAETLDLHAIAQRVRTFAAKRFAKPGVDPVDYQTALAVANRLDAHPSLHLPTGAVATRVDVPVGDANAVKRALYTSIRDTSFGLPTGGAKKATEKFAAHQLKIALERKLAAIAPLNARESQLITATRAIAKAVEREANQNPLLGTKTLVTALGAGASGASGATDPTTALVGGLALRLALTPSAASLAAIVAARTAKTLGVSAATAARLAVYATLDAQQAAQGSQD